MLKSIALMAVFVCGIAHAATQVTMNVSDLKTGKPEAKLTLPLWAVKTGLSFSKVLNANDDQIDIEKLIANLDAQKRTGSFLVIEDHEGGKKISFELQ